MNFFIPYLTQADFYLFHNVCEMNVDAYLDEKYGLYDYLMKQKANGRIRHLGFSSHGSYDVMERFLEKYGKSMEFCQIQLNYLDWSFQDAKAKVELLKKYHIPVCVMEPLRGGRLANLTDKEEARNGSDKVRDFQWKWIPLEERYFQAFQIAKRCELCFDEKSW